MAIPKKVLNYLEKHEVPFEVVTHRKVYTAFDAAQTMRKKIEQIAKNLLVKTNRGYALVIVPANRNIDIPKLEKLMKKHDAAIKKVSIPKEQVMAKEFKVKPGALPAFGGIYNIPVYLDKNMEKVAKIIFSSGSFTESFLIPVKKYIKLENPVVGVFSKAKKIKPQKKTAPKKRTGKKSTKKKAAKKTSSRKAVKRSNSKTARKKR